MVIPFSEFVRYRKHRVLWSVSPLSVCKYQIECYLRLYVWGGGEIPGLIDGWSDWTKLLEFELLKHTINPEYLILKECAFIVFVYMQDDAETIECSHEIWCTTCYYSFFKRYLSTIYVFVSTQDVTVSIKCTS